jgi:hypothetical protein
MMTGQPIQRIEQLFQRAADLPPAERGPFLERECEGDSKLRAHVEAMLAQDARGESLDVPAARPGDELSEEPGTTIGRYKLLQHIGDGGFGSVYMAEQTEPVLRKVALKIIKLGMDTRQVVARFEAERQALAMMDHPNIAKVLDGGATETGRPYFVMELVRGISITEYCDQNNLNTAERLKLFAEVCLAVQHAHQKGVIHRDIKPSNVMVTLHDGQPVPKVIDFGIAKATHGRLTEKTLFTEFRQFIGTPVYMSPEQAEMSGLDIDTRSDIYSLGVLLYELLTGTTPFDTQSLLKAGFGEIQRIIREEEPPMPSVRISTAGSAEIAKHRKIDVGELSKRLRGDLDWIVMRALEKDRSRRYASANELAEDIRRHLGDLPVVAGPPSAAYRMRKFLVRNRAGVGWAAMITLALFGGIVGTTWGMVEASRQRDQAVDSRMQAEERSVAALTAERDATVQRDRAQQAAGHARAVTDFLMETLAVTDPMTSGASTPTMRELLDRAAADSGERFVDQPRVEASVRGILGRAYKSLGLQEQAVVHLRRSVSLMDELGGFDRKERYETLWILTSALFQTGANDAWAAALRARRVGHDYVGETHPELATLFDEFVRATDGQDFDRAEIVFLKAKAAAAESLESDDPLLLVWAESLQHAGYSMWYSPFEHRSEALWSESYAIQKRILGATHPKTAETLTMVVGVLNRTGRAVQAEELIRDSVDVMRETFGTGNINTAFAESMLGESLTAQGKFEEAETLLVSGHEVLRAVPDDTSFIRVDSLVRVCGLYDAWGKEDEARRYRREFIEIASTCKMVMPYQLASTCLGPEEAGIRAGLEQLFAIADIYGAVPTPIPDEPADIGAMLDELFDEVSRIRPRDELQLVLGRMLIMWSASVKDRVTHDDRRRLIDGALKLVEPFGAQLADAERADALAIRSGIARVDGDDSLAADLVQRAWALVQSSLHDDEMWLGALGTLRIGRELAAQGRYDQAERLLLPAHETFAAQQGPMHKRTLAARAALAELYTAWGKPDQAAEYTSPQTGDNP